MMTDLPQLQAMNYGAQATGYNLGDSFAGLASAATPFDQFNSLFGDPASTIKREIARLKQQAGSNAEQNNNMSARRIVQVFIADPNDNVPLERSLLFQDDKPRLTDLTDQELFFEIDIRSVLQKHNEYRVTLRDKAASERSSKDINLEAAKIRDLKMTVVCVAQF